MVSRRVRTALVFRKSNRFKKTTACPSRLPLSLWTRRLSKGNKGMQNQSPPFVRRLRRIIGEQSSGVSDTRLLERFVLQRDEAAFELLLWRHERMVASVCRWVLGHEQDAEDAFQATFLTLACKAGSIGKGQALAS